MQLTDEQYHAIHIQDQNLIVTAGAGSGKTRVLVERYLNLLDTHPDWRLADLVAITFTEKAAREMRDRVRDAVQGRLRDERWRALETQLDSARIGTIHSLCATILRANPAEAGIDPAFEVLDEVESALLLADAIEATLAEIDPNLLVYYGVRTVRENLRRYVSQDTPFDLPDSPDALLAHWQAVNAEATEIATQAVLDDEILWQNLHWEPPGAWPRDDKLTPSWDIVHQNTQALSDGATMWEALSALDAIRLTGGAAKNWGDKAIVAETKDALRTIREQARHHLKNWPRALDADDERAAEMLFFWQAALQSAHENFTALKAERALLDFNDLERLTVQLLNEHPNVAERYASAEFQHLMVDEFQDTNVSQREILYRLSGMAPGKLFVVGDPRQSIYAFRGADVSVFHAVQADIVAQGGQSVGLSRSFRTHRQLVATFNDLFGRLMFAGASYEVDYGDGMSAERPAQDFHRHPFEMILLDKVDKAQTAEDLRNWEAAEIAHYLHSLFAQQAPVYDKDLRDYRPFQYGDAAILFRSFNRVAQFEAVFKSAGLPYVTLAGKGYFDRQEVWDMLNLLRVLHNPADDLALASVLRSPMFGFSDDELLWLRLSGHQRLWDALMECDWADFARVTLTDLARLAGRVTVVELLTAALDATAYDAIVSGLPDGARRRGNLEKLMDKARQSGRITLGDFTAYVGDLTASEAREGEAVVEGGGAVKIMTVHASKGLEFPVVVIAEGHQPRSNRNTPPLQYDAEMGMVCSLVDDAGERLTPFAYEWVQKLSNWRDLAEHKRLLYVAATRAQDYLLITGRKANDDYSWIGQICTVYGIDGVGDWGGIRVHMPATPPELAQHVTETPIDETPSDVPTMEPPLLAPLDLESTAPARHLSVTQLEYLGGIDTYDPREAGVRQFRHSVFHDAPEPVAPALRNRNMRRIVGAIVHKALRVNVMHKDALLAYAWDEGITGVEEVEAVLEEAQELIQRYLRNDPLANATKTLREIPFVLQTRTRTIHGVIDVLYQRGDEWVVLDYKTAPILASQVPTHAQQYIIQLGAYAQAVSARLGKVPRTLLYYLHPSVWHEIPTDVWQAALDELDDKVETALRETSPPPPEASR